MKKIWLGVIGVFAISGLVFAYFSSPTALAVSPQQRACEEIGQWTGSECIPDEGGTFSDVIEGIITILLLLIGVACVVAIIIGGIMYTTSAGDTGKMTTAKNTILYAVVGLVVAIMAFAIVNFILGRF